MAAIYLNKKDVENIPNRATVKVVDVLVETRKNYNELMDAILAINATLSIMQQKLDSSPDVASVNLISEGIEDVKNKLLPNLETKIDNNLKRAKNDLLVDIKKNTDRLVTQEGHSRRKNVIINGKQEENGEVTEEVCRKFLKEDLHLDGDKVDKMIFRDVHRLPKPRNKDGSERVGVAKPIIMAFICQKDRNEVLRNAFNLKGTGCSIKSDLPKELNDLRSRMLQERNRIKTADPSAKVRVAERAYKPVLQRGDGYEEGGSQRIKWTDIPVPPRPTE